MLLFSNTQKNYNLRYKAVNWKKMEIFQKALACLYLSDRSQPIRPGKSKTVRCG